MRLAEDSIAVVGGGLAGTCLAVLLAQRGWAVRLFEAQAIDEAPPPARDQRTLALARASWDTLAELGITPANLGGAPIARIHVSFRGRLGSVVLEAGESGQADFGHTVGYGRLIHALRQAARASPQLDIRDRSRVARVEGSAGFARLVWHDQRDDRQTLLTRLAVVADGGGLSAPGPSLQWTYRQHALGCLVETDPAAGDQAWERFTREGPLALLPTAAGHALIWTGPARRIATLQAMDDRQFLAELQDWFGDRAGRFLACSPRLAYPLAGRFHLQPVGRRVLHIANAAQTLHPVAGQGFNLGLRDVRAVVDSLGDATHGDPGSPTVLARYRVRREVDRQLTSTLTHLLAGVFTLPLPGLGLGAALGLGLLDSTALLRTRFARLMADGVAS